MEAIKFEHHSGKWTFKRPLESFTIDSGVLGHWRSVAFIRQLNQVLPVK